MTEYGAFIKIPGCRKQGLFLLFCLDSVTCWCVRAKQPASELSTWQLLEEVFFKSKAAVDALR